VPPQNIEVEIRARLDQLESQVGSASRQIEGLEQASSRASAGIERNMQRAGTALVALGTSAVAVGSQAVGLGNEFERNMARIEGLVGIARGEVDQMRGSVMQLAGRTATAPQELSNALFTITSAGLRGSDAMEALDVAARGSAAGMGDTRSVATALTGVLNAYATSGITAAQAGDFLAGTARAGNFEVSELAGSIGRVLPMASAAGVALSDVGGSIALLTRNGLSASEAVTQTSAVMRGLVTPTSEAAGRMEELGLSSDQVRGTLQNDGLVAALQMLWEATGQNVDEFAKLVGGSEAAGAALSIVQADASTIEGTFGLVADSAGILDEAFNAVAETNDFKLRQAMVDIRTSLTEVGLVIAQIVVPAAQTLATGVGFVADAFLVLPGPLQSVVVGLGGIAGPAGLALLAMSRMSGAVLTAGTRLADTGRAAASFGSALGVTSPMALAVGAAITVAAGAYLVHRQRAQEAEERARALTDALSAQAGSVPSLVGQLEDYAAQLAEVAAQSGDTETALLDVTAETDAFLERLASMGNDGGAEAFDDMRLSVAELLPVMQSGTQDFALLQGEIVGAATASTELSGQYDYLREQVDTLGLSNADLLNGMLDQAEAAGVSVLAFADLLDVLDEQSDAYDDVTAAQRRDAEQAADQIVQLGGLSAARGEEAREAIRSAETYGDLQQALADLVAATEGAGDAAGDAADGLGDAADAASDLAPELAEAAAQGDAWVEAARNGAAEGDYFADALGRVEEIASQVDDILSQLAGTQQSVDSATMDTVEAFDDLAAAMLDADGNAVVLGERLGENRLLQSEAGREALSAARDTASAIQDETLARVSNGEALETVRARQDELTGSLRAQLEQLGFHPALIERIIADYAAVPDQVLTTMAADTAQAQAAADEIIASMLEYGELTPEAVLMADERLAAAAVRSALLDVSGFDATEAVAALDASSVGFDAALAIAVLQLDGWDSDSATAAINGDPAQLQSALDQAMARLELVDSTTAVADVEADTAAATSAISGTNDDLDRLANRRTTAEVDVAADQGSVASTTATIDNVAEPARTRLARIIPTVDNPAASRAASRLSSISDNGGRGYQAVITAIAANAALVGQQIDYMARDRTTTIYIRTVGGYANGGIRERMANGGVREPHIVPAGSNAVLYGEPETGGEAFIPLGPQKRATAVPVLATAANRMGFALRRMADGGIITRPGGALMSGSAGDSLQLQGSIDARVDMAPVAVALGQAVATTGRQLMSFQVQRPEQSALHQELFGRVEVDPDAVDGIGRALDEGQRAVGAAGADTARVLGSASAGFGESISVASTAFADASGNLLAFEDRLERVLAGDSMQLTIEAPSPGAVGGGVPIGGGFSAGGGGGDLYGGLGQDMVEIERTSSGLVNGLQQQLLQLGLMPDAINEISREVSRLPRQQQMSIVVAAQAAIDDTEQIGFLLHTLDGFTAEPLMQVDVTQPRHDIGDAMMDLYEFDSREARAALAVNRDTFDPQFAGAVLSLSGFDETEVTALINGDTEGLRRALDEAMVALGLFEDTAAQQAAAEEAALARPEIDTGSGLRNRLGLDLQELGLADDAINGILRSVERMPRRQQLALAIDADRAMSDSTVLVNLLERLDGMTPRALLGVEGNEEVRRRVGEGLLEVNDFAGREAVAALRANSDEFDRPFARSVLELQGFSDQEATALLNGNRRALQDELDAAVLDLGLYGRTREDATVGAETDEASLERAARQLGNVADPHSSRGNPGGIRGRMARIEAIDRGTAQVAQNLDIAARDRVSTVYVRTVAVGGGLAVRAQGGIDFGGSVDARADAHIVPAGANAVLYGEPSTGGEAFIPLGANMAGTAVPILRRAAATMGFELVEMAGGGILGSDPRRADPVGMGVPRRGAGAAGAVIHQHNETNITAVPERIVPSLQRTIRTNRARAAGPTRESMLTS
jgi:TP901 family phage tail tape measure protein